MMGSGVADVDMCKSPYRLAPTLDASTQDCRRRSAYIESVDNTNADLISTALHTPLWLTSSRQNTVAIGHFNILDLTGLKGAASIFIFAD